MVQGSQQPPGFILTESIRWDSSWPEYVEEIDRKPLLGYLEERFGIPCRLFDEFLLFKTSRSWHLLSRSAHIGQAARLKAVQAGLKVFDQVGGFIKPTTRFVQVFGRYAGKAVVEIDKLGLQRLLSGGRIPAEPGCSDGYVILSLKGYGVIGLGLLIRGEVRGQLRAGVLAALAW